MEIAQTPIKRNKVKPTEKQLRAFNLAKFHPKWTWAKIMREAGYKGKTPEAPGQNLLTTRGFIAAQALWPSALARRGIHIESLADKFKDLLGAKKQVVTRGGRIVEVEDKDLQFKVAESLKKDLGIGADSTPSEEKTVTFKWKRPIL